MLSLFPLLLYSRVSELVYMFWWNIRDLNYYWMKHKQKTIMGMRMTVLRTKTKLCSLNWWLMHLHQVFMNSMPWGLTGLPLFREKPINAVLILPAKASIVRAWIPFKLSATLIEMWVFFAFFYQTHPGCLHFSYSLNEYSDLPCVLGTLSLFWLFNCMGINLKI